MAASLKGKGPTVDLVSMTLDQVDKLQTRMLKDPDNRKLNSSAIGRYQIVRTRMRAIRKQLPNRYPGSRLFDADCQDEMACYLLGLRGIDKYLAGRLSEDTLLNNLAQEWASLPTTKGTGHYGGQRAAVKPERVRLALAAVKKRHAEGQAVREVEVVPEAVEKKVKEKSGFWQWLTGLFGSGALGLGWLAGMDWQAILAGGVVLIVILLVLVALRSQIIAAVREIKAEVAG